MLSPDVMLQAPDYSQSHNRYSYVFNNPLKFTDPTGMEGRGYDWMREEMDAYWKKNGKHSKAEERYDEWFAKGSNVVHDVSVNGKMVGTFSTIKEAQEMADMYKVGFVLPDMEIGDVPTKGHELIQHTLDHLDNYTQRNRDGDPYQNSHGLGIYSAEQFWQENQGKSYFDIITQRPWRDGLPGGPNMRMVRNPQDGRIMDMRHVMVVGYGGGNILGLGVEIGQWLGPYYGKPGARESAFDRQDFYSNNMGAAFFTNSLFTGKLGKDWSSAFYLWINKK